jgi:hypothetical protein
MRVHMTGPLIAIVGDVSASRVFCPPLKDANKARQAARELGGELAQRGARLLVYGGPFLEADVVRGFVEGKPSKDRSIVMSYTKDQEPAPFAEEASRPNLFERRMERGVDWEIAFYRSIARADGVILIGGAASTAISGQVAIGTRKPILALAEFGGAAAKVWETLSAGDDLPNRQEINVMARPWGADSAAACVTALYSQYERRRAVEHAPQPILSVIAALLFLSALAILPWTWGGNVLNVWMLFLAPLLAGGSGAAIRPVVDRLRGSYAIAPSVLATIVVGLVAGGVAGVLFVTAQLAGDAPLAAAKEVSEFARRSMPFALGVGFIAGLTSDAVFGKLTALDVVRGAGIEAGSPRA